MSRLNSVTQREVDLGAIAEGIPGHNESAATTSPLQPSDEVAGTPTNLVSYYGQFFEISMMTIYLSLLYYILLTYEKDWDRKCDHECKIWSTGWMSCLLFQLSTNMIITQYKIHLRRVPVCLILIARFAHTMGGLWWLYGSYVVFFAPKCKEETTAYFFTKILFWGVTIIHSIPLILCLSLPCIIYYMVQFAVRPADRLPTPPEILSVMDTKTYRDLVDSFRGGIQIDTGAHTETEQTERHASSIPGLSIGSVIGGVSTLLGSSTRSSSSESPEQNATTKLLPSNETVSINTSCPICMTELDDSDIVMIMPCDQRHFFHKSCVEHWLETSQACPICRANIVNLITGTSDDPSETPPLNSGTQIELV